MDINDEQLLLNDAIYLETVGDIYQSTVKEISKIGYKNYLNLLTPFLITNENIGEQFKGLNVYDLLFVDGNMPLLQQLIVCLGMFFKKDIGFEVQDESICFKIGEDGIINKQNFDKIQEVVRQIHRIKLAEPEKTPKNMTPEKLRIHEKLRFHRSRRSEIEEPTFKEIINVVMHKGKSFIPYDIVGNFTYYQLINSYQVIVGLSNFDEYMGYKLSPKFEPKEDMPAWQKIIKMI